MNDAERARTGELGTFVTRGDLYFHQPRYRDYRWLETNWFSWLIPEHDMRCHIRSAFRTNLDVVETTVFVFNDPKPRGGPLGILYADARSHVPMPRTNLDGYDLASGLSVRMVDPGIIEGKPHHHLRDGKKATYAMNNSCISM